MNTKSFDKEGLCRAAYGDFRALLDTGEYLTNKVWIIRPDMCRDAELLATLRGASHSTVAVNSVNLAKVSDRFKLYTRRFDGGFYSTELWLEHFCQTFYSEQWDAAPCPHTTFQLTAEDGYCAFVSVAAFTALVCLLGETNLRVYADQESDPAKETELGNPICFAVNGEAAAYLMPFRFDPPASREPAGLLPHLLQVAGTWSDLFPGLSWVNGVRDESEVPNQ